MSKFLFFKYSAYKCLVNGEKKKKAIVTSLLFACHTQSIRLRMLGIVSAYNV